MPIALQTFATIKEAGAALAATGSRYFGGGTLLVRDVNEGDIGISAYVRVTDPITARKAKATPGLTAIDHYQSVIQATWMNNKKKPLDDPRVRRAMHLVLDKPVLVDVVKDVAPMLVGIMWQAMFERYEPLDINAMVRAHIDILFAGRAS